MILIVSRENLCDRLLFIVTMDQVRLSIKRIPSKCYDAVLFIYLFRVDSMNFYVCRWGPPLTE
jgi:hypothetical protein